MAKKKTYDTPPGCVTVEEGPDGGITVVTQAFYRRHKDQHDWTVLEERDPEVLDLSKSEMVAKD